MPRKAARVEISIVKLQTTPSESEPAAPNQNRWMTRGVLGIGLGNLFSDWGHEAATSLLPALLSSIGAPPIALGIIEGVADGLSSFAKLAGGWIADRPAWRKPVASSGCLVVALSTFAYSFANSWPFVLLLRAIGWAGRGGKSPSRDALLADAVSPEHIGRAFGFERAMDTLGAIAGPLMAVALVASFSVRAALRWTLLPGLAASLVFFLLVPAAKSDKARRAFTFFGSLKQLPAQFRRFLAGIFAHGIGDFAPTLLILRATQILKPHYGLARASALAISLYVVYNVVFAVIAFPLGLLADRIGKRKLLALGYLFFVAMCIGFVVAPQTLHWLALLFAVGGVHAAAQEALEKSVAAELAPSEIRGTGFGVLATVNGIGDFASSIIVGALWTAISPAAGFLYSAVFTVVGAALVYFWR